MGHTQRSGDRSNLVGVTRLAQPVPHPPSYRSPNLCMVFNWFCLIASVSAVEFLRHRPLC